jgi:peptidyl-prolyl cis-trans isomerase-like 4
MAVLLETSVGDLVFDLHVDKCPNTCKNFLKLCKIKYYNGCLFHNVQKDFIAQSGDPTGTGRGGSSLAGVLYGDQARFLDDELRPELRHVKKGTLSMASGGQKNTNSTCGACVVPLSVCH